MVTPSLRAGPLLPVLLALVLLPVASMGQEAEEPEGWNSSRVLTLVAAARELRQGTARDPGFQSYSSQARGYVHFFIEREDTGERILVKTDQIALEVYWAAPNRTRQRIVGLRDEKALPTNIRYHLDHLVVVQDEFGDLIRIGDGDEVEAVLHPVAPGAEGFYDFLLTDSVTVTLPGAEEPVRVYEIRVRPKNFDIPGFIGSIYLDRATSAIVRMGFTFTPASYVDAYLDHIRISLENGLWMGKYWLPYRQQLEIRREVPYLDIPAGSIIKGWFEIRDYEINPSLPITLFRGPTVTALPEAQRRAFPFEEGLHDRLDVEGLTPPPEMEEIRALAVSIAKDRFLSGLDGYRLYFPAPVVSSTLRFNRAEGFFVGGGLSYGFRPYVAMATHVGYAFGRERPSALVVLSGAERYPDTHLSGYLNKPTDLSPGPATSGVMNSLSTLALDRDYRDLYFAGGARISHKWGLGHGMALTLTGRSEAHRAARDEVSTDPETPRFRPVFPAERGTWHSLSTDLILPSPWESVSLAGGLLLGRFETRSFGEISGRVGYDKSSLGQGFDFEAELKGGVLVGEAPRQGHYLLGGRGTVPGYAFRSQIGDRFWLLRAEAAKNLLFPWVRLRAFGAAGGTGFTGDPFPPPWPEAPRSRILASAGGGLGLGWDVLRLDLARGLTGSGEWQVILSVNPEYWPWL